MKPFTLVPMLALSLLLLPAAQARLGETEEQSTLRYGPPVAGEGETRGGPGGKKTLLEGAKEVTYNYQGWKIRVGIIGAGTQRIEYSRAGESLTEKQVEAILDAEKGALRWKEVEEKKNDLRARFPGRGGKDKQRPKEWSRTDKALAKLTDRDSTIVLETSLVTDKEKKGQTTVPKF
jgi:hypothetical protein